MERPAAGGGPRSAFRPARAVGLAKLGRRERNRPSCAGSNRPSWKVRPPGRRSANPSSRRTTVARALQGRGSNPERGRDRPAPGIAASTSAPTRPWRTRDSSASLAASSSRKAATGRSRPQALPAAAEVVVGGRNALPADRRRPQPATTNAAQAIHGNGGAGLHPHG